jgi:hypothetical protein
MGLKLSGGDMKKITLALIAAVLTFALALVGPPQQKVFRPAPLNVTFLHR